MSAKKKRTIGDQLRQAIQEYGTMYAVGRDSGVPQQMIHRFMVEGRDLRLQTVERLCTFFGMYLTEPVQARAENEAR